MGTADWLALRERCRLTERKHGVREERQVDDARGVSPVASLLEYQRFWNRAQSSEGTAQATIIAPSTTAATTSDAPSARRAVPLVVGAPVVALPDPVVAAVQDSVAV
jgi:hypothetical protein